MTDILYLPVSLGVGGSYLLCKSFSVNNISFIPFHNLSPHKDILYEINSIDNNLVDNMDEFIRVANNFVTVRL
jgi:hypothetical protein